MATQKRFFSEIDAAAYLAIGRTTFRGLGIPRKRLGMRVVYEIKDLDDWADTVEYEGQRNDRDESACDAAFG